jgi:hypothetical protein
MGLFGSGKKAPKKQLGSGQVLYCPNGHPVDASWDVCPECMRLGLNPAGGPNPAGAPAAGAMANYSEGNADKTVGIDVRGLEEESRRHVVGWIVAQTGNHRGMDFRLFEGKNVVGTAANCDIVVTDAYLSARHCTIRYDNGNFVVIDLDSRNGTYVNSKKISKYDLIDNDTVRLGKSEFKFKSLF